MKRHHVTATGILESIGDLIDVRVALDLTDLEVLRERQSKDHLRDAFNQIFSHLNELIEREKDPKRFTIEMRYDQEKEPWRGKQKPEEGNPSERGCEFT